MKQLGKFDYHKLMHDQDLVIGPAEEKLIKHYQKIVQKIGDRSIGMTDEKDRYVEVIKSLRKEMAAYGDEVYVTDVLVAYFFGLKRTIHKAALWDAYGSVIYQNLLDNKAGVQKMCMRCGNRFTPLYPHQCLCDTCAREGQQIPEEIPEAYCIDCGRLFQPMSLRQTRCTVCQWLADNPPPFDMPTAGSTRCEVCGTSFQQRSGGRGRRQKVCDHCRDVAKREATRLRVTRHRSKIC